MDRVRIKEWAKNAFYRSYWKSVLVGYLLSITMTAASFSSGSSSAGSSTSGSMTEEEMIAIAVILLIALGVSFFFWLIAMALKAFLLNPLQVGCQSYFRKGLYSQNPELGALGDGFKGNYKNVAFVMFMKDLFLWLWSLIYVGVVVVGIIGIGVCAGMAEGGGDAETVAGIGMVIGLILFFPLLIAAMIPWIMKYYEYLMIPFILAENPNMPRKEVFALTKRMMTGDKWNAFVLILSFFGWNLLGVCTCGILNLFYVMPYQSYAVAGFYETLKQKVGMKTTIEVNPMQ